MKNAKAAALRLRVMKSAKAQSPRASEASHPTLQRRKYSVMKIETGLFDHGVLQRDANGYSNATITGTCATAGPVTVSVFRAGETILDSAVIGDAENGAFSATLKDVPTGGPYSIALSVGDEATTIDDVLIGDLWLLGGQSNMQGIGLTSGAEAAHPDVRNWYMDDRWAASQEPLHNMFKAVDAAHAIICGGALPEEQPNRCVGPGIPFGNEMQRRTGVPQGTIACAHGGTTMEQWHPERGRDDGKTLYSAMIRRLRKVGGKVAGLLWYQGESDVLEKIDGPYTQRMIELCECVRSDCNDATLPISIVQISRYLNATPDLNVLWMSIQDQQLRLPDVVENLTVVAAIDLQLDDTIHIGAGGHIILGRRLAQAMVAWRDGAPAAKPITPASVVLGSTVDNAGGSIVTVTFDNVEGELQAAGRPWGFTCGDHPEDERVLDVQLRGNQAILTSADPKSSMDGYRLWYGVGINPYCNIFDSAGRALPAFGPIAVGQPRAMSRFCRTWNVSVPLPSREFDDIDLGILDTLTLRPRRFCSSFADRHVDWTIGTDEIGWYTTRFVCTEPMRLRLLFGYDGPVKLWLDGELSVTEPNGTNPGDADKSAIEFDATPGDHDIAVALCSSKGQAWGVMLRLQRLDVDDEQLEKPWTCAMPEWV
jgi:sialate O-acetylesterase